MERINPIVTNADAANTQQLTPLAFLARAAATFPEREAVVYGQRRTTYAAFEAEVQQFARALALHVKPGQVVSFVTPNVPEMLVAH